MNDGEVISLIAFVTTFWIFFLLGLTGIYFFSAFVFYRIGRKFGIGTLAEYCIPVYGWVLLCRCANLSPWNLLWFLVPGVGWIWGVVLFGRVAERLGHNFWAYGLAAALLYPAFLSLLPLLILAFDDSMPVKAAPPKSAAVLSHSVSIHCVAGEFAGSALEVGPEGMIIGRSPDEANLVLASPDVSKTHLRLWPDQSGAGVWAHDMQSTNGSSWAAVRRDGTPPEWMPLKEPTLLPSGAHFRVADNAAEFVVA